MKRDNEPRSARTALGAHRTAELLAQRPHDVETDADAAFVVHAAIDLLALCEGVEDGVEVARQSHALVVDRDLDATADAAR